MKNALFVTEKWCDGTPEMGLTNNFHNLFNSFQQSVPEYNFNTLHLDESYYIYGRSMDDILVRYCSQWKVDIIFFCLLGGFSENPSFQTFVKLKELGVKLCFIWPDTGQGWAINTMYALENIADLQVSWDRPVSEFHNNLPKLSKYLSLWAPQDSKMYNFKSIEDKEHDIAFFGRPFLKRANDLAYLKSKIPNFISGGGQREQKLSPEQYAYAIGNSKIIINFPYHALGFSQLKSRVLEAMASGSLVFELKNESTSQLFEANQDFVEYQSLDDAVEKYVYYINNLEEMKRIAKNGYIKYLNYYSGKCFWKKIFENIE